MKIVNNADDRLVSLMDEIGLWLQVTARIPRFYLVPLLTLVSLLTTYVGSGGSLVSMATTMLVFMGVMSLHLFEVHKKGAATEEMAVNTAVEGLRSNTIYLAARTCCFILFAMVVAAQAIAFPWKVPLSFLEFFFLFYPSLIYQHEPPPRHEMRSSVG